MGILKARFYEAASRLHAPCELLRVLSILLRPFTMPEVKTFVRTRRPEATQSKALFARSDGNPPVIANLIEPGRALTGESEITRKIALPIAD